MFCFLLQWLENDSGESYLDTEEYDLKAHDDRTIVFHIIHCFQTPVLDDHGNNNDTDDCRSMEE